MTCPPLRSIHSRPPAVCCAFVLALAVGGASGAVTGIDELAERTVARFGEGYTSRIDRQRGLVYVSALDEASMDSAVRIVGRHWDAMRERLFSPEAVRDAPAAGWAPSSPRPVVIVLPTVEDYRRTVRRAWPGGAADLLPSGFYDPRTRTLVSISLSDVLLHELTHALHHGDQLARGQSHAIWIREGLATLFQRVEGPDGSREPTIGRGLVPLQAGVRRGEAPSIAELARMDRDAFLAGAAPRPTPASPRRREASDVSRGTVTTGAGASPDTPTGVRLHYLQARYVMLYLYRRRRVRAFYEAYTRTYETDPSGLAALREATRLDGPALEEAWREWVLGLEPPVERDVRWRAHLGVRMGSAAEGVRVSGLLPGSAAERAGLLQVGDVILSIGRRATPVARALTTAVREYEPGQTVPIELIRDGERIELRHVLGASRSTAGQP